MAKFIFIVIVLLVFLSALSPSSNKSTSTISSSVPTHKVISWLNKYYTNHPVGGGWRLIDIVDDYGSVRVDFEIPKKINAEHYTQQKILKAMCPNQYEDLWDMPFNNQIEIFVNTFDRKFSALAKCPSY